MGYIETFASGTQVALATNDTNASSFASRVATKTRPSGVGVFDISNNGNITCNALRVQFFGAGSATNTFKCRILGWNRTPAGSAASDVYTYCTLTEVTVTLGTATGVDGTPIVSTNLFADSISLATGFNDDVDVSITAPGTNVPAHMIVDTKGCELIEFLFHRNSSATSCNALFGKL